jgi:transposase
MVGEIRGEHESDWAAMARVAELLGVGTAETVRKWVRQAEVDAGERAGSSTDEQAEIKKLKAENKRLREDNAILRAATVFFASMPQ